MTRSRLHYIQPNPRAALEKCTILLVVNKRNIKGLFQRKPIRRLTKLKRSLPQQLGHGYQLYQETKIIK